MQNNSPGKTVLWAIIALIIGGIVGYIAGGAGNKQNSAPPVVISPTPTASPSGISQKQIDLRIAMRKLWEDHITWTRLYVVDVAAGNKGASDTAARLLKNQEDIGNAIKPYYGDDAGNKLTTLLKDHILGAVAVLTAAKAGNKTTLQAASADWYKNADDIAAFLSTANPANWPAAAMKDGMKMHLDLTLAEAVAELGGKYPESVADYDKVHDHILGLADALSGGIIAQFPAKF
jgi:hypothetical protein